MPDVIRMRLALLREPPDIIALASRNMLIGIRPILELIAFTFRPFADFPIAGPIPNVPRNPLSPVSIALANPDSRISTRRIRELAADYVSEKIFSFHQNFKLLIIFDEIEILLQLNY